MVGPSRGDLKEEGDSNSHIIIAILWELGQRNQTQAESLDIAARRYADFEIACNMNHEPHQVGSCFMSDADFKRSSHLFNVLLCSCTTPLHRIHWTLVSRSSAVPYYYTDSDEMSGKMKSYTYLNTKVLPKYHILNVGSFNNFISDYLAHALH